MRVLRFKKLRDISIAKRLYFIVGAMAVLILVELLSLWFAIHTLSSVRTLVGAEGLWSKAQKDAFYRLRKYYLTHNDADYTEFQQFMKVPLGDHTARIELLKEKPDLLVARKGFEQGRVNTADIDGVLNLLRRFHDNYYINKAIRTWAAGDSLILKIMPIADTLHSGIQQGNISAEKSSQLMARIDLMNEQLTLREDEFSFTLGEGSRWLENLILKILLTVAITVEFTGLFLTILVTRGITKELGEINKATRLIGKGDLTARAAVLSKNEIGQLAVQVNQMTEQLILSNTELGQVAYIASHDLQEPLRTISNFVTLFQKKYKSKLDTDSEEYLAFISEATVRMQMLVKDLLDYSRIGSDKKMMEINCNQEVDNVIKDMSITIEENDAEIHVGPLPVVQGYFELQYLFQNLISNAIKYRQKDIAPCIYINAEDTGNEWTFSVKDNGIGIEKKYYSKIFTIFQKLHSNKEYEGTGIGLAHCKKIADLHRGKIWLVSETGKGSTFFFTIPKQVNV